MSLVDHAPKFSTEDAKRFAYALYGINAAVNILPSQLLKTNIRCESFYAVPPPSTASIAPVTKLAASLTRYSTEFAISIGWA